MQLSCATNSSSLYEGTQDAFLTGGGAGIGLLAGEALADEDDPDDDNKKYLYSAVGAGVGLFGSKFLSGKHRSLNAEQKAAGYALGKSDAVKSTYWSGVAYQSAQYEKERDEGWQEYTLPVPRHTREGINYDEDFITVPLPR